MEKKITWEEIYKELSEKLPTEAIERSEGSKTGKGYNTTGYSYQYVVNRFNDVLGLNGWDCEYRELDKSEGVTSGGKQRIAITVESKITLKLGQEIATKTCIGGHISSNYADALKGAYTNALKKTAALFGVGKKAYEGSIDDDNENDSEDKTTIVYNKKITANKHVDKFMKDLEPTDEEIIAWSEKLESAESLNQLKTFWAIVPPMVQDKLVDLKERLKNKFVKEI